MSKISLVLEGGGMRGAYTAGALAWLLENNIEFDNSYGISTGAVHLASFLLKDEKILHDTSTEYIADSRIVGLKAVLQEGRIVSYDLLFSKILKDEVKYPFEKLKDIKHNAKIGLYDLDEGKTIYYPLQELGSTGLKAACSLPILGKVVKFINKRFLDGGITEMIPIKEAIKDGNNKHLVITTKPLNYERKKAPFIIRLLMRIYYLRTPAIARDYSVRHLNYEEQIGMVKDLADKKEALYFYPSKDLKVSRLSGDPVVLNELYQLGYSDMEKRKEEIFDLVSK